MLSPFATSSAPSNQNSGSPPPQQLYANQHDCSSKPGFGLKSNAYPALSSRAARLLETERSGSGMGFSHNNALPIGFGTPSSINYGNPMGTKLPDYRSLGTSNALNTADLQFSGYILNGSHDLHRPGFSYTGASSDTMTSYDANSHVLECLGVTSAQSFSAQPMSGRDGSTTVPAYGHGLRTTGLSVTSTPYQSMPTGGIMPLIEHTSYASLLNKANLMFDNNLDSMTVDWALEERECRRRLVQFWRRHENNNIFCTFKDVAAADRVPNSIVVSCIYWEERQDFFITSVDCIYLLESLIAVRFTVEEKNRIRRNLEGFRPLTISKCKAESADFFKLIMSFPTPKPRNIEKDVKVFPWRILPLALKKIISKYTASYSSTASSALDAFPASRAGGPQLAGVTLSAPAGGMMAFSPHTQSGNILGSASASASTMSAAAVIPKDQTGAHMFTPSPASGSSSLTSSSANLVSMLEMQAAARLDSSNLGFSSMLQPSAEMCLGVDVGVSTHTNSDVMSALAFNSAMTSTGQWVSPAAAYRGANNTVAPAYLQSYSSGTEDVSQGMGAAYSSGHSTHLGLAGMAINSSMSLLSSAAQTDTTASLPTASIFEQLAASCGFPALGYEMPAPDTTDSSNGGATRSQHVVRGASTKRTAQHAPYSVNRSERQKLCSTSSDCGAKGPAQPDAPERGGTSLSSFCDEPSERRASPSVSLILKHQGVRSADDASGPGSQPGENKAGSVPFHDLLRKPLEDGACAPAQDHASTDMLGFGLGDDIASGDFTFLANLIRMSSQSDSSLDSATIGSATVGSASPIDGSAAPETGSFPAWRDANPTDNGLFPDWRDRSLAENTAPTVLPPPAVLAKSASQFASALKPSQTSLLMFGSALLSEITAASHPSDSC
ncbi:hypothetical protein IW139_002184 [Coemansia sp. RSA 353]|nr:hypothetical protein GGH15_003173 [Coemansia sp. RSA 562]KAJ2206777.1 hypothetical protein IW145_001917 [Coemansia sp. RSA 521]KAJ2298631.1 hypothetical protein IW139_002184 [Coemansia sp. RSA 353]